MRNDTQCPAPGARFGLPGLATLGLTVLLLHRSSGSPVIFGRYSVGYSVLLLLAGVHVVLLWLRPRILPAQTAILALLGMFSVAVVADFLSGIGWITIDPVFISTFLAAAILVQTRVYYRAKTRWKFLDISLQEVALITITLMFALVGSEVALRLVLVERLTPKTLQEFRSLMAKAWPRPISMDKPEGTVRIAGLADSMGVVGGPSENYHYLLEDLLGSSGLPAEMMNISVSGNSPRHELAMLELAMAYEPDVVLHSFYVGNDFTLFGEDTYQVRSIRIDDRPGINRFLPRDFFLADFITNGLSGLRDARLREEEFQNGLVKQVGHLSLQVYLTLEYRRLSLYRPSEREVMSEVFPILDAIRKTAVRGNARYAMVINPDQIQVDPSLKDQVLRAFHVREGDLNFDFPQQLLREYCESRQILCLDLLPVFRATNLSASLYTVRDGHYSRTGNQTAATAIRKFMIDNHVFSDDISILTAKPR